MLVDGMPRNLLQCKKCAVAQKQVKKNMTAWTWDLNKQKEAAVIELH